MSKSPISAVMMTVLAATTFSAGLSEFIVIGLLGKMAGELDAPLSQMGLLVTAYAAGIAFGAPLLTRMTLSLCARSLTVWLMLLFAAVSAASATASSLWGLLAIRICAGAIHGAYFSIASAGLSTILDERRTPIAIALMFSGLTLAMVMGVPLGMLAAENYGWQAPFLAIAAVACVSGGLLWYVLPEKFGPAQSPPRGKALLWNVLFNPALIRPYCFTVLAFGGGFVFFSYVEPWLSQVADLDAPAVALVLSLVGGGSLVGNILGGVLPGKLGLQKSLVIAVLLQCLGLSGLFWVEGTFSPVPFLLLWSLGAFATAPMVQNWAIVDADKANARLSASLNVSAFNLGLSLSSFIATRQVNLNGIEHLPVTAAIMVSLALPFCFFRPQAGLVK
ncbi:TPA: MFS transporter [Salmonella enterica]|uniref:MFS transporter n=1 Tax=Salmonella enterica TaxID=28901 RepID=A0A754EBY7_SALER|nr:MFS transporter [Salmonella enterica]ECU9164113.1 MFS transporter [Salmonella enterica subsp. enterica serovar Newport str. CFSAN000599]EDU1196813.1 MFS transporter [Salmonella enterica subsp. enterica serovar Heidelberg str. CFSAN000576]HAF8580918.1 MFS transporter [Salmonella enterica]